MNEKTKLGIALLVGLIIGYFAGREHLKYEFRSSLQDIGKKMNESLSGIGNITRKKQSKPVDNSSKIADDLVLSWSTAGLPTSPDSLILWIMGS